MPKRLEECIADGGGATQITSYVVVFPTLVYIFILYQFTVSLNIHVIQLSSQVTIEPLVARVRNLGFLALSNRFSVH